MANFYIHDGKHIIMSGNAPDGMEELQAFASNQVVILGDPPYGNSTADFPGAKWNIETNSWEDTRDTKTKEEHSLLSVYEKRVKEYPEVTSQLDMLWHAMDQGILPKIEPMYSDIKAVKLRNPKPGGNVYE